MTTAMTTKITFDASVLAKPIKWPFTPEKVAAAEAYAKIDEVAPTLAELARQDGIQLLYHFDREYPTAGGYTIAYRPSQGYVGRKHGKMVDVAVAYCSEGDTFSKKIGRDAAIMNFRCGQFIQVPALLYGDDYLHTCLREMFSWDL
jgi:hypothetical protein